MMSVLIPLYNRDVNHLVSDLSVQASGLTQPVEIIVLDDGSAPLYQRLNNKLNNIPLVRYIESGRNNGRIRIRQILCEMAVFDWVLFLDCDSKILSNDYLARFLDRVNTSVDVVAGGRVYASAPPDDCLLRLHWKYGTKRETYAFKPVPGKVNRFMTNNFLIKKNVFRRFTFNDAWQGYGYEDSWMSIQLESMGLSVCYIDNPLLHEGVENALVFISKSENALRNLLLLSKIIPHGILSKHVRLFSYYLLLKKWRLLGIIKIVYGNSHVLIKNNLQSCKPSLQAFDIYRLNYFIGLAASEA